MEELLLPHFSMNRCFLESFKYMKDKNVPSIIAVCGWELAYGWDLHLWMRSSRVVRAPDSQCRIVATVLGSITASSDTVESEGRQTCLPEVPLVCLLSLHEPEEEGEEGLPHLPLWYKAHLQQRTHQGRNQLQKIYMLLGYSKNKFSQNGRNMILNLVPLLWSVDCWARICMNCCACERQLLEKLYLYISGVNSWVSLEKLHLYLLLTAVSCWPGFAVNSCEL